MSKGDTMIKTEFSFFEKR